MNLNRNSETLRQLTVRLQNMNLFHSCSLNSWISAARIFIISFSVGDRIYAYQDDLARPFHCLSPTF